jgi:hypothetical protein
LSSSSDRAFQERYAAGAAAYLHRDQLEPGPERPSDDAGAGHATPAADRPNQHVDLRLPLEDLEGQRGDARDEQRLVARVDVAVAALRCQGGAVLPRLVVVAPVLDHLATETPHGGDLHGIGAERHDDHRAHAEQPRGVSDRPAVVAG